MIFRKNRNETLPPFFGVAWTDVAKDEAIVLPLPFNIVAGAVRTGYYWLRWGWKSVPVNPHEAYAAGFRHGAKACDEQLLELKRELESLQLEQAEFVANEIAAKVESYRD